MRKLMSLTLPDLPYPYDALAPYMSRETLEYPPTTSITSPTVNNANNLLKGPEWAGKSLEEIRHGIVRQECRPVHNAAQHYNPHSFLEMDEAERGGNKLPEQSGKEDRGRSRLGRQDETKTSSRPA